MGKGYIFRKGLSKKNSILQLQICKAIATIAQPTSSRKFNCLKRSGKGLLRHINGKEERESKYKTEQELCHIFQQVPLHGLQCQKQEGEWSTNADCRARAGIF